MSLLDQIDAVRVSTPGKPCAVVRATRAHPDLHVASLKPAMPAALRLESPSCIRWAASIWPSFTQALALSLVMEVIVLFRALAAQQFHA